MAAGSHRPAHRPAFASILAIGNVSLRWTMYLLGHTDSTLTLALYQQVLDMRAPVVADVE